MTVTWGPTEPALVPGEGGCGVWFIKQRDRAGPLGRDPDGGREQASRADAGHSVPAQGPHVLGPAPERVRWAGGPGSTPVGEPGAGGIAEKGRARVSLAS